MLEKFSGMLNKEIRFKKQDVPPIVEQPINPELISLEKQIRSLQLHIEGLQRRIAQHQFELASVQTPHGANLGHHKTQAETSFRESTKKAINEDTSELTKCNERLKMLENQHKSMQ